MPTRLQPTDRPAAYPVLHLLSRCMSHAAFHIHALVLTVPLCHSSVANRLRINGSSFAFLSLCTEAGKTAECARCGTQAAQDCSWQMNTHDISQTMRGLANLRLGSRLLVQALVHRAAIILDTFNTQVSPSRPCCLACPSCHSMVVLCQASMFGE